MTKTAQQVLLDALHLSQPERATVANSLLESLDPPPPDKEGDHEEWLGEIERRARAALAKRRYSIRATFIRGILPRPNPRSAQARARVS